MRLLTWTTGFGYDFSVAGYNGYVWLMYTLSALSCFEPWR